eukprot:scaffold47120_cov77-Cyclotella_meneghiniana.AAC.3
MADDAERDYLHHFDMEMEAIIEENDGDELTHKQKLEAQWLATCYLSTADSLQRGGPTGTATSLRQGNLSPERTALLERIGLAWYPRLNEWDKMYEKLREYKEEQGHCNVPKTHTHLYKWVARQRSKHQDNSHTIEQATRLNEIGFVYDTGNFNWDRMYNMLQDFKNKKYSDSITLSNWSRRQRSEHRKGALGDDRINLLRQIGFDFKDGKGPERNMYTPKARDNGRLLTKEERHVELWDQNNELRKEVAEQAETIKRLKATIMALTK